MMSKGLFTFCQTSRPMRSPPLQCVMLMLHEKFEDLMEIENCFFAIAACISFSGGNGWFHWHDVFCKAWL